MARSLHKMSALDVSRATGAGLYGDGGGLWMQITTTGGKSWVFRYTRNGKSRTMGLGPLQTVSLAQAREAASEKRLLLHQGKCPIEDRRAVEAAVRLAEASAITFETAANRFIDSHKASWKSQQHLDQWEGSLAKHVFPVIGYLPVGSIDTVLVLQVLEPIWLTIPATARRLRGRIEQVLDWAKARGMRAGENPARWRGHLLNLLAKKTRRPVKHQPSLPYDEVGDFMQKIRSYECLSARALEFTILTAARSMEVIKATWSEVDLQAKAWVIPADRMKAGVEHRVPLSAQAIKILEQMQKLRKEGDFIFPGTKHGRSLSDHTMLMFLKLSLLRGDIVVHGFRSSFRDWAAECTSYPREVVELALAHSSKSETEAAYFRSDLFAKRAKLMALWADFCDLPSLKQTDNVLIMKGAG